MATRYHFTFKSSDNARADYEVYDRETNQTRRIYVATGSGEARFMFDAMGADVLSAFNAWRRQRHDSDVAWITERYGADEAAQVAPFVELRAA